MSRPHRRSLTDKPDRIDAGIEETLTATLGAFAITLVFGHVGNKLMIETDFARFFGIERTVRIEESTGNDQPQALDGFERLLEVRLEIERSVRVASHAAGRRDNIAVSVGDGQNVTRFGPFSRLVGHAFSALLGDGMGASQKRTPSMFSCRKSKSA
jgi:hypothetical protein